MLFCWRDCHAHGYCLLQALIRACERAAVSPKTRPAPTPVVLSCLYHNPLTSVAHRILTTAAHHYFYSPSLILLTPPLWRCFLHHPQPCLASKSLDHPSTSSSHETHSYIICDTAPSPLTRSFLAADRLPTHAIVSRRCYNLPPSTLAVSTSAARPIFFPTTLEPAKQESVWCRTYSASVQSTRT